VSELLGYLNENRDRLDILLGQQVAQMKERVRLSSAKVRPNKIKRRIGTTGEQPDQSLDPSQFIRTSRP
jgi:hypothetical protein